MALIRTSTNSWLNDTYPTLISMAKIRPTNLYSNKPKKVSKLPIMLVEGGDGFYYIVDGNHQFFNKLILNDDSHKNVLAWILTENVKKLVSGNPLPKNIKEWVEGEITLKELTQLSIGSFNEIESKIGGLLENHLGMEKKFIALNISQAILKNFKGNTSLQKEIEILGISIEDFLSFQKCFVDGGINAIFERIKKEEKI